MRRPIEAAADWPPAAARYGYWLDTLALDGAHDYDPVWRKCEELGYPVTFHSAASNFGLRNSISNFVYNHMGHFASANDAVCKSLFLGGVTRRFPKLKFLFLEGGVGWARTLLGEIKGHWEKRNRDDRGRLSHARAPVQS